MGRRPNNKLERWEVSLIKAMCQKGMRIQDIQSYFSRPTRSINNARISEIKDAKKHKSISPSDDETLDNFLANWPNVDPSTGLHHQGDELIVKAREAMIAAVHTFNSAGLYFRAELFIVTSVIAWTYLLHAYYKREGVDYRYKRGDVVQLTPNGAEKYWELEKCLSHVTCPIEKGAINNLRFLIDIRHEIEHRKTDRIDNHLSAKLQACCINFNDSLRTLFGKQFGLEKRLPIALQFVTFEGDQRGSLKGQDLPAHISAAMDNFHRNLTEEEQQDTRFRYRVAFVPKIAGKAVNSDQAIEFVKPGSDEAVAVERILLKEVERKKYRPSDVVVAVRDRGHPGFSISMHTHLWKELDAKMAGKGFGVAIANTWYWYDSWVDKVVDVLNQRRGQEVH